VDRDKADHHPNYRSRFVVSFCRSCRRGNGKKNKLEFLFVLSQNYCCWAMCHIRAPMVTPVKLLVLIVRVLVLVLLVRHHHLGFGVFAFFVN